MAFTQPFGHRPTTSPALVTAHGGRADLISSFSWIVAHLGLPVLEAT